MGNCPGTLEMSDAGTDLKTILEIGFLKEQDVWLATFVE